MNTFFAVVGIIAAFIVMVFCTIAVVFGLMFGGEEFSPPVGIERVVLAIFLIGLILIWGWFAYCMYDTISLNISLGG